MGVVAWKESLSSAKGVDADGLVLAQPVRVIRSLNCNFWDECSDDSRFLCCIDSVLCGDVLLAEFATTAACRKSDGWNSRVDSESVYSLV